MANNRLWLVHKSTGERVMLGKRMVQGWYVREGVDMTKQLDNFFAKTEQEYAAQDDFELEFEDDSLRSRSDA